MNRALIIAGSMAVLLALIAATPSLWQFYLWTTFPQSAEDRVKLLQAIYGTGRECGATFIDIDPPSEPEVKACFSNALIDRVLLYAERPGQESVTRVYRCDIQDFSGELVYTFYATTERYVCDYKIGPSWDAIPKYQTGDIAGYSPYSSLLTRILITVFRSSPESDQ